jgi:hypothetical protein
MLLCKKNVEQGTRKREFSEANFQYRRKTSFLLHYSVLASLNSHFSIQSYNNPKP